MIQTKFRNRYAGIGAKNSYKDMTPAQILAKRKRDKIAGATPQGTRNRVLRNKANRLFKRKGLIKTGTPYDIDHKVPLSKGGTNNLANLRVMSRSKNRANKNS
jgi:5-methylcytosine-specific restriction endonuclease McrA